MIKTATEMTDDILSSIGMKNVPERVLIEAYIEKCLESAKNDVKKEILEYIQPHDVDVNGNIVSCNYHNLFDILNK